MADVATWLATNNDYSADIARLLSLMERPVELCVPSTPDSAELRVRGRMLRITITAEEMRVLIADAMGCREISVTADTSVQLLHRGKE